MTTEALAGRRILIIEDEFLIAMDLEQLCRDNGALDVTIHASVRDLGDGPLPRDIDAAIIDVMVDGRPTLDFARRLAAQDIPFIFATGYSAREDIFDGFAGVPVVGKPFNGDDLVAALTGAIERVTRR